MAISIPLDLIGEISRDSIRQNLLVQKIPVNTSGGIAGDYEIKENQLIFTPLIPFTHGSKYRLSSRSKYISEIAIPVPGESPKVVAIYPGIDSLPENLLKFYIRFSKPMAEGHAMEYVSLQDAKGDSLSEIFLDLKPELWNEDGTVLTLWLDPGRIKRDLQPNKRLGAPMKNGEHYKLIISANWPDQEGALLTRSYSRNILAIVRDSLSPSVDKWNFKLPVVSTTQAFEIDFHEPLDYFLAEHVIHLQNQKGDSLEGNISISRDQRTFYFTPKSPWTSGRYRILVENILEDLAGNNLNRPFDHDLSDKNIKTNTVKLFKREFNIPKQNSPQ